MRPDSNRRLGELSFGREERRTARELFGRGWRAVPVSEVLDLIAVTRASIDQLEARIRELRASDPA